MKKFLLLLLGFILATLTFSSCKKEEEEGPGYYFRFQADGVAYDYKYEMSHSFTGSRSNMGAFQSTSTGWGGTFQIYGYSRVDPTARGEVRFFLNKDDFNTLDTIVLDGVRNWVETIHLGFSYNNFTIESPLSGKIIILEKAENHLKGRFYYDAYHINYDGAGGRTVTDTILHVTSGEFMVPQ